jgi:hypothetical protein
MGDWFAVYDGVFFLGIATLFFGCLGLVVRTTYRSKCKDCSICFGLIKITRDTEGEVKEDIMGVSPPNDKNTADERSEA